MFEEWDSGADLDAHLKGDWYRDMFAHLYQYTILSADISKYRVTLKELVYGDDGIASGYFSDEK